MFIFEKSGIKSYCKIFQSEKHIKFLIEKNRSEKLKKFIQLGD